MRTLSSIIFLGPGTELAPFFDSKYPKFEIPILNKSLLLYNLEWIAPLSNEIFIVCHSNYLEMVRNICNILEFKGKLEIFDVKQFDGTVTNLRILLNRINFTNILVSKGDIITTIDFQKIYENYLEKKTNFFTVLKQEKSKKTVICHNKNEEIFFYSDDIEDENFNFNSIISNKCLKYTNEFDSCQIYIFKKKYFEEIEGQFFSFKTSLLPYLINKFKNEIPVRCFFADPQIFLQILKYTDFVKANRFLQNNSENLPEYESYKNYNKNDYESLKESKLENYDKNDYESVETQNYKNKNFIYKNKTKISKKEEKNIIGENSIIDPSNLLKQSIIGKNCKISENCTIDDTIILNNVKIGKNCQLKRCFVGNNVKILDDSQYVNCYILNDYVFKESVIENDRYFKVDE